MRVRMAGTDMRRYAAPAFSITPRAIEALEARSVLEARGQRQAHRSRTRSLQAADGAHFVSIT